MNKKFAWSLGLVIVAIILLWFFGFDDKKKFLDDIQPQKQEVAGEIASFYISKPNLVVETTGLESVSVYATPADRKLEDYLFGEGMLVEEYGERKTWIIEIPEPQLVRKVYAIGADKNSLTTEREVFPIAGISEIYYALWAETPEEIVTLSVGESASINDTRITLNRILEDSRCPQSAKCIQAGRVVAEISFVNENLTKDIFVISSSEEDLHIYDNFIKIIKTEPLAEGDGISNKQYKISFSIIRDLKL